MTRTLRAAICLMSALAAHAYAQEVPSTPPWQAASPWPDRIVLTMDQDPKTAVSVSWRTSADVAETRAEIVLSTPGGRFDLGAAAVPARSQTVDLSKKIVDDREYALGLNASLDPARYHTATFTDLQPGALYAYRVMGAEGHWSEWFQTRTAPDNVEPFKFLYFGDAQEGILSHWARVIRAAYLEAPDARFAIHAGDLVNFGSRDFEWAEWFKSSSFIHGMIPALPVVGNHEYFDRIADDSGAPVTALSVLWRPQFALPRYPELPEALQETVYATEYGDALIVTLDTMADQYFDVQAAWLDEVLTESDAKWRIVTMHHPVFELLERRYPGFVDTGPERRSLFLPVLRKHAVDLVLQGHDHVYGRGALTSTGASAPVAGADAATVFVTSSSGAKMYGAGEDGWGRFAEHGVTLQRQAENTQFFQVIEVNDDALVYEAFMATGELYDAFRIEKTAQGPNRIVQLDTDFSEERTLDNSEEYSSGALDRVPTKPAAAR